MYEQAHKDSQSLHKQAHKVTESFHNGAHEDHTTFHLAHKYSLPFLDIKHSKAFTPTKY